MDSDARIPIDPNRAEEFVLLIFLSVAPWVRRPVICHKVQTDELSITSPQFQNQES